MLIGSFLEALYKEAFEIDDIKQSLTVIDRLHTESDNNNNDSHGYVAQPEANNKDLEAKCYST